MIRFAPHSSLPRLALLFLLVSPIRAQATLTIFGSELTGRGTLKAIADHQRLRHEGIFERTEIPLAEQRLRAQAAWSGEWLLVEYAGETSFIYQQSPGKLVPTPELDAEPAWRARWDLVDEDQTRLTHRIDRLYAQAALGAVEIRAGKQVIAAGVGQIFNAVSQVPRHPFVNVDAEYERTEDALSATLAESTVVTARFLPKVRSQEGHNFHVRLSRNLAGADTGLTIGRSDDKGYAGLEIASNVLGSVLLAEVVGYRDGEESVLQALTGVDRALTSTLSARVETFFNGFGKREDYLLEPFRHRSAAYRGRWYLGTAFNWEATSRLKTGISSIVNLLDTSALFHFSIAYSWEENLDLLLGQYLNVKSHEQSEFGGILPVAQPPGGPRLALGLPDMTYAALRWSF